MKKPRRRSVLSSVTTFANRAYLLETISKSEIPIHYKSYLYDLRDDAGLPTRNVLFLKSLLPDSHSTPLHNSKP